MATLRPPRQMPYAIAPRVGCQSSEMLVVVRDATVSFAGPGNVAAPESVAITATATHAASAESVRADRIDNVVIGAAPFLGPRDKPPPGP
jgi:hypothetical protein